MRPRCMLWMACTTLAATVVTADADDAWEEVRTHCGGCHSLDLVTSQRNSRDGWRQTIRTMQRSHNMPDLAAETETRIVAYLAEHYAPETRRLRRSPIPATLMP